MPIGITNKMKDEKEYLYLDINRDVIHEKQLIETIELKWDSQTSVTEVRKYDLNRYYTARIFDITPPQSFPSTVTYAYLTDVNKFWTDSGLTLPYGYYNYLAVYSKASLIYPFISSYTKLPDLTSFPSGTSVYFCGFEHGGSTKSGIATFILQRTTTGITLSAMYGSRTVITMDITSRLPADYITAYHNYYTKVNRWGAEFFIDNNLVAVAFDIPNAPQGVKATAPPYAIGVTDAPVIKRLHTLIEILLPAPSPTNIRPNFGSLTLPLQPIWLRWGEDDPNPPRALRLYQAGSTSLMTGASVSSGSISSHPIPIYGRDSKTVYFMANQTGTMLIEVYTLSGNWRTYDSINISADTLTKYRIDMDGLMARITFTPSTYPATILEAEAYLR
jgi:hypothetical protein